MTCHLMSPVGGVRVDHEDGKVFGCEMVDVSSTDLCVVDHDACRELRDYFAGKRQAFSLAMTFATGTLFQRSVWEAIQEIPFGETRTYGQIAAMIGRPKAVRAVGGALNKNPIWVMVPCHRVVGSKGEMTGYAGGIATKEWLLRFEKALP